MSSILCGVSDMIFATKIRSTAAAVGADVHVVAGGDQLLQLLDDRVTLVIVDLNMAGDSLELIRSVRARSTKPRLLAFVSHVQAALARAARDAGADEVLPRSRFSAELPALLSGG